MKVIFLDVDGVLNSDEYFDKVRNLKIKGIENQIDVEKIKLLKKAVDETGAKVVLSSSWRFTLNEQPLRDLLSRYGIGVYSRTPYIDWERGLEIKKWLSDNKDVEDFVIVDDEIFDSFDEELVKKVVKISDGNGYNFGEGLSQKDIDEIINRLGRIKGKEDNEQFER